MLEACVGADCAWGATGLKGSAMNAGRSAVNACVLGFAVLLLALRLMSWWAAGAGMFLQPAVQYVGVHGVGSGQSCDGCAGFLAGSHQIGLELGCVGAVGTPICVYLGLGVFEHRVHDWLSGHDLVRSKA